MSDTTTTHEGFSTAIAINAAVAVVAALLLAIGIVLWPTEALPRAVRRGEGSAIIDAAAAALQDKTTFPVLLRQPPRNPIRLFWLVLSYPSHELLAVVGLDGVIALGLAQLGTVFFGVATVFCTPLLLPINILNVGGDGSAGLIPSVDRTGALSLDHWAIANLSPGSPGLWAHTFTVYALTALLAWLLLRQWRWFVPLRYHYLSAAETSASRRSVLVVNLPRHLSTDRALLGAARELYGDEEVVESVSRGMWCKRGGVGGTVWLKSLLVPMTRTPDPL